MMDFRHNRKGIRTIFLLFAWAMGMTVWAQVEGVYHVALPGLAQAWKQAEWHEANTGKHMQGVIVEAPLDFFAHAQVSATAEGDRRWVLQLEMEGAPATCVYFEDFHMPVGASLRFETPEGAFPEIFREGPIDFRENNDHGKWVSGEIPGGQVRLIYEQPAGVVGRPRLHIRGMGCFFRDVHFPEPFTGVLPQDRGSDACQVDVNCPEGAGWECQRDAVVRLRISMGGSIFLCSGVMVNNTARDCRQLLLSSFHCADDMSETDWALMKVRYNYEYLECGGIQSINSHDRTGVFFLTSSDDMNNGNISGSDFLLMEVEDEILDSWNPYLAGWDANGTPSPNGVGIHHPSGDRKKISTYTNQTVSSSAYAPGAHWRVTWAATETNHGVTEGGSSGSPLFNNVARVIGTLTGGSSLCTAPTAPDYYGKFSYHWNGNNPIPTSMKLFNFLDPAGTGEKIMDGSRIVDGVACEGSSGCDIVGVEQEQLTTWGWSMHPNPARDVFRLQLPAGLEAVEVRLYDAMGRWVRNWTGLACASGLAVGDLAPGTYLVTIETTSGVTATQRLQVAGR